jgi:hypothetical protein
MSDAGLELPDTRQRNGKRDDQHQQNGHVYRHGDSSSEINDAIIPVWRRQMNVGQRYFDYRSY